MDSYKKSRRKSIIAWIIAFVLAIGAAIVSFTPFIFMVLNSFKEKFEMLTKGVFQLPDQLNWSNYTEVLTGGFANYFKNSVIVLAISLILLLFISACASYPLARFKFKMAQPIYAIIVACMSIPVHITLIPGIPRLPAAGYDSVRTVSVYLRKRTHSTYLHHCKLPVSPFRVWKAAGSWRRTSESFHIRQFQQILRFLSESLS